MWSLSGLSLIAALIPTKEGHWNSSDMLQILMNGHIVPQAVPQEDKGLTKFWQEHSVTSIPWHLLPDMNHLPLEVISPK